MYTFANNSQSISAVCFSLLELSILNLLHNASKLIGEPGNLFLAISSVSIIFSFVIFSFPAIKSSLLIWAISNSALWIIIFLSLINSRNSLAISLNFFLSDKKKFSEIADDFLEFIKDKKIIIHNAEFDIAHINNELLIAGKEKITKINVIDTLDIARNKFPGSAISLDALCKRFRIDNSKREKHTALIDCELLSKVYINLIDQKEPKLNFQNQEEQSNEKNILNFEYYKKIITPSEEEIKKHREYLKKNLKKNYFN